MKRVIAYYLPFDRQGALQLPLIWENGKYYAWRHGIACLGLGTITVAADVGQHPIAMTLAFAGTCVTSFLGSVFAAAALDPRWR